MFYTLHKCIEYVDMCTKYVHTECVVCRVHTCVRAEQNSTLRQNLAHGIVSLYPKSHSLTIEAKMSQSPHHPSPTTRLSTLPLGVPTLSSTHLVSAPHAHSLRQYLFSPPLIAKPKLKGWYI